MILSDLFTFPVESFQSVSLLETLLWECPSVYMDVDVSLLPVQGLGQEIH